MPRDKEHLEGPMAAQASQCIFRNSVHWAALGPFANLKVKKSSVFSEGT
jgi:hypothetical protein